jgi:hypothetical protein
MPNYKKERWGFEEWGGEHSSHLPSKLEGEEGFDRTRQSHYHYACLAPPSMLRRCGASWHLSLSSNGIGRTDSVVEMKSHAPCLLGKGDYWNVFNNY